MNLSNKERLIIGFVGLLFFIYSYGYLVSYNVADDVCSNSGGILKLAEDGSGLRCFNMSNVDVCKDYNDNVVMNNDVIFNFSVE